MLSAIKNKLYIPKPAIEIFLCMRMMCNMKKCQLHHNIVVWPITTKDFNLRVQVDLIDFQSTPCGEYKWLMNNQDHATKFCLLRPLKTKHATEVAAELLKIVWLWCTSHFAEQQWTWIYRWCHQRTCS